jgi:hypothetical protein
VLFIHETTNVTRSTRDTWDKGDPRNLHQRPRIGHSRGTRQPSHRAQPSPVPIKISLDHALPTYGTWKSSDPAHKRSSREISTLTEQIQLSARRNRSVYYQDKPQTISFLMKWSYRYNVQVKTLVSKRLAFDETNGNFRKNLLLYANLLVMFVFVYVTCHHEVRTVFFEKHSRNMKWETVIIDKLNYPPRTLERKSQSRQAGAHF